MLTFAWALLLAEIALAVVFGSFLWHFWSGAAMERPLARRAIAIYAVGAAACILLAFVLPL